jgi:hypothetical protein
LNRRRQPFQGCALPLSYLATEGVRFQFTTAIALSLQPR